jgi:hypothetical protein
MSTCAVTTHGDSWGLWLLDNLFIVSTLDAGHGEGDGGLMLESGVFGMLRTAI